MNNKNEIMELLNQAYIGIQNLQMQSSRQNIMLMSNIYSVLEQAVKLVKESQAESIAVKVDK